MVGDRSRWQTPGANRNWFKVLRASTAVRAFSPETLLLYLALSLLFFGRNLIGHFSDRYIGMGHDPDCYLLFWEWWRYALANHLNPFHLSVIWAPTGFNLARVTSAPAAAWALMPIEAKFGPVPAYNAAILLCPPLSAWSAFLLCRRITERYLPSLVGGYVFGFSPYMLAHILGHPNLAMVFLLPVAVCLVLRWFELELSNLRFVELFALLLAAQFLIALEVLASMTLLGGAFLLLVWIYSTDSLRQRIRTLIPLLAASFMIVAALMSPYLYYLFGVGSLPEIPGNFSRSISSNPARFFVPVSTNVFGYLTLARIAGGLNVWEAGDYIGLPLFLVVWTFARSRWGEFRSKLLTLFLVIVGVASLGPALPVLGKLAVPLPWALLQPLPLVDKILPERLFVFAFLDLGVIAAMWLSDSSMQPGVRVAAAAAIVVSLLPNLSASFWTISVDTPGFFRNDIYKGYLSPGENVLILPYGNLGDAEAWLANTRMYFKMAGGYQGILPPVPPQFEQYPIVTALYNLSSLPYADEQLKAFLVQKGIGAVIVADEGKHIWREVPNVRPTTLERRELSPSDRQVIRKLLSGLGVQPVNVGGVAFYRVRLEKLEAYKTLSPTLLQERAATVRLATLIEAAHQYVARGLSVGSLNPLRAQELGLLPPLWVTGSYLEGTARTHTLQDGLILGRSTNGEIGVGLLGPHDVLRRIARQYDRQADKLSLLPPEPRGPNLAESMQWVLLLRFKPDELAGAAEIAHGVLIANSAPLVR